MRIPTTVRYGGDREAGKLLRGRAAKEMAVLENNMRFQGLKQDRRQVSPYPGVTIICHSVFDRRSVEIIVEPSGEKVLKPEPTEKCFCTSCFAAAIVLALDTTEDCTYYDVGICHNPGGVYDYTEFLAIRSIDLGVYDVGQLVMVSLQPAGNNYCCPGEPIDDLDMCLFSIGAVTGGTPVIVPIAIMVNDLYGMWKWKYDYTQ